MITGMDHAGVVVLDLERAIQFYTDALGLKLRGTFEAEGAATSEVVGYEAARLKGAQLETPDGQVVELLEYIIPPAAQRPSEERSLQGASHLGFTVDDIQRAYETLISRGGRKLNPPVQASLEVKVCYLQDPEGNWIELVERAN